jgi:hypothetical protein
MYCKSKSMVVSCLKNVSVNYHPNNIGMFSKRWFSFPWIQPMEVFFCRYNNMVYIVSYAFSFGKYGQD